MARMTNFWSCFLVLADALIAGTASGAEKLFQLEADRTADSAIQSLTRDIPASKSARVATVTTDLLTARFRWIPPEGPSS